MPLTRSIKKDKRTLKTREPKILQQKSPTSTICEVSDSEKNHSDSSSKNSKLPNVRVQNVKDLKVPRSKSKRRSTKIFKVSDSEENHSNSSSKNSKLPKRNVKDSKKSKSRSQVEKGPALISNEPNADSWGDPAFSRVDWGTLVARRKRQRPESTLGSEQNSEDSEGTPAPPAAKKAKNAENAQGS